MPSSLTALGVAEIRDGLQTKRFSCAELVSSYLDQLKAKDDELGSFLQVDADGATASAAAIDARLAAGQELPALGGAVVAVKDNIVVRGLPATAASKMLEGYVPPYDATVVTRLRKAGAVILGKTNLDEFAMGASTEQSAFHPTKNPRDPARVTGGSSGGSAAAVAANFCTVALGSDTGGSIRQPAAFCGIVGLRPTYGRVSRHGLIALASSMDVIGPLARSVADARALLHVISGHDPADATSLPESGVPANGKRVPLKGLRIGLPKEYLEGSLTDEVRQGFDRAREALERGGVLLKEISLPMTRYAVPTYYVITPAEAFSNLARYDGIRFGPGHDSALGHGIASRRLRGQRFGLEPKRRIMLGTFTLSSGYADRYYHTAQRVRTLIRQDFANALAELDLLLTPTTPSPAFPLGSVSDPLAMYQQDVFLAAVSLAGLPAVSLPVPTDATLPVGVQLIGRQSEDARLLDAAEAISRALA